MVLYDMVCYGRYDIQNIIRLLYFILFQILLIHVHTYIRPFNNKHKCKYQT